SKPNTHRPPNLSVITPKKSRLIEPDNIGVAMSRPSWVSLKLNSCWMRIPRIEKIVHTAKQRVKAKVESPSARYWSEREIQLTSVILWYSIKYPVITRG